MLKKILIYLLLAIVVVFLVIFGFGNIYHAYNLPYRPNEIGDSAGLLNSFFSGIALILVIITIFIQKKDLNLQQEELKSTRKELSKQRFENTFFNMLRTQDKIIYNLEIGMEGCDSYRAGIRVFKELYDILTKALVPFFLYPPFTKENIVSAYASCTELKILDHYFRHMYRIVKFVNETDFSFCLDDEEDKNKIKEEKIKKIKHEKYQYTSILRATLSPYELVLLFYNCLNEENKFRPLIEEYCLLQNIRSEFLKKDILAFYKNNAYGNKYEDIKQELENKV